MLGAILLPGQQAPVQKDQTGKGVNFYSVAREVEIGRLGADEFTRRVTVLRTPAVTDYLAALSQELSAEAPGEHFSYRFAAFRGHQLRPPMAFPGEPEDASVAMEAITLPSGRCLSRRN
ncbi:MAG TPA: hypothetical protein VGV35_05090 [Bryobacteraceae bacterium]|nr:hypothetical protein [Bryobacteraceae bacterium]